MDEQVYSETSAVINAFYEPFPEKVSIAGKEYSIVTDFRDWIRFADMMSDKAIPDRGRLMLMLNWFIGDIPQLNGETVTALYDFYRAGALDPDMPENDEDEPQSFKPRVIDWKFDAKYIIGDFLHAYRIDLLTAKMHWWKFRLLFAALPDDAQIMKRIAYRSADPGMIKNESERKRVMRMKQLFALPYELEDEDIAAVFGMG